jgi:hypothetical protein
MKKLLPDSYLATQERLCEWFDNIRRATGCGENADTGAVLRAVEAMGRKVERYEEEQAFVARSRSYRYWGDYYNAVRNEVPEAVPIELPADYNEVPLGWFRGKGKPSFDKCEKRLMSTHKVVRKVLAYTLENEPFEGQEWATELRSELYKKFVESTDPDAFEKECLDLTYDTEEEDPATTWVEAADTAAAALEKAADLPLAAVEELIAYAYKVEVEVTKTDLAFMVESEYEASRWFDYLLTALVMKTNRATRGEVEVVTSVKNKAFDLWKCYKTESANDPLRPTRTTRFYDPAVSVELIEVACREVRRLQTDGADLSTNEWVDAVVGVVAAINEGNSLVTAEKK